MSATLSSLLGGASTDENGQTTPPDLNDQQQQQQAPPVVPPVVPSVVPPVVPPVDPPADPPTPELKPGDEGYVAPVDPPAGDEELTTEQFFAEVDKLSGVETVVDYGDVDPWSPQGILMRDQFIVDRALNNFEQNIKQTDPRAYAYLLHRQNGGDDASFFEVKSFVLPTVDKLTESVDLQRTVYAEDLRAKGNSEEEVEALLKIATEGGKLLEKAKTSHTAISARDTKLAETASKAHELTTKKTNDDIAALDRVLTNVITQGKDLNFTVPDAEKTRFLNAVKDSIVYEGGEFFLMKPINTESLPKLLDTELFAFLGGDLKKMVAKQAQTISAQRFIKRNAQVVTPGGGGQTPAAGRTLGELVHSTKTS